MKLSQLIFRYEIIQYIEQKEKWDKKNT